MRSPWHLAGRLLVWITLSCALAHAAAAVPVAMVTDLKGRASFASQAPARPLGILDELPAGAELVLEQGADLTLVYVGSGHEFRIIGSGRVAVGVHLPVFSGNGKLASRTSLLSSAGGRLDTQGGRVVQGAVVMRGAGERLRQIAPRQKTLDARPEFRWDLPENVRTVAFELRAEDMQVLASASVTGASYTLPPDVALVPGKTYSWSIAPGDEGGAGRVTSSFTLGAAGERQRLVQLKPGRDASFSDRLLYALLLEDAGLAAEATAEWKALSAARPQDAMLRAKWSR
ncbi:MAG TPA: hypothetical protein VIM12_14075 [Noviherbaspirillum sp.]|jgi:hypothetical protein|uniref:hypothetical protein n=1 Tax=Noviherbaspirillum sp. TaxID=1926288 RepID=UPI002F95F743